MNEIRTIDGRWWIHGEDKAPHFGTLFFDPEKGLDLIVKIPQSRTGAEFFHNITKRQVLPKVMFGKDEHDQDVSLFGCSDYKWSTASGLDSYHIKEIGAAILNYKGSIWSKAVFSIAKVDFTLLNRWLNRTLRFEDERGAEAKADGFMHLKFKLTEEQEFKVNADLHIRVAGTTSHGFSSDGLQLGWRFHVWFMLNKPVSARIVLEENVFVFQRLLCLLAGERVFIEKLSFWSHDPFVAGHKEHPKEYELLIPNKGLSEAINDLHALHMVASFDELASDFDSILKAWFHCHEQLRPVLDLYFAIISNWVLTEESRFLFFAQALEVYHARSKLFTSKGQTKFLQRINEVIHAHPAEAALLFKHIPKSAERIRDSRNYYTHYDETIKRKGKVAQGLELRRMTYAIFHLLQICLLREVGIQGKPIQRIVERNSAMKWEDLKS